MGSCSATDRASLLTTYLLDTTVLIAYLRGATDVESVVLGLVADGHTLATTCVNLAELERGVRRREQKRVTQLVDRLRFLVTDREAARRAGRYQADWAGRGRTVHTADALVAGTARTHGAVLLTHNVGDFPMRDIRVERPPSAPDG